MKRKLLFYTLALGLLILPTRVLAQDIPVDEETESTEELVVLTETTDTAEEDETALQIFNWGEDVVIVGDQITYSTDVEGDLFVFGGAATIESNVKGDVFVGVGTVVINGEVGGNLLIGAGTATVSGNVGGKLLAGTGAITMIGNVEGDVYAGAGTVSLTGDFGDDVRVAAGQLALDGSVADELRAHVSEISKDAETTVGGVENVTIVEDAIQHKGTFTLSSSMDEMQNRFGGVWRGFLVWRMFNKMLTIVGWSVAAMLVISLAPVKSKKVFEKLDSSDKWLRGFGIGALILLFGPIIALILLISVVGAPLSILGTVAAAFVFMISSLIGKTWVGYKIMNLLGSKTPNYPLAAFVGVLSVSIVCMIPIVGSLAKMILLITSFGLLVDLKLKMYSDSKK